LVLKIEDIFSRAGFRFELPEEGTIGARLDLSDLPESRTGLESPNGGKD
jgi:hypothetical protein